MDPLLEGAHGNRGNVRNTRAEETADDEATRARLPTVEDRP